MHSDYWWIHGPAELSVFPTVSTGWHTDAVEVGWDALGISPIPRAGEPPPDWLRVEDGAFRELVERVPLTIYIDRLDERSSAVYMSAQIGATLGYQPEQWLAEPDLFVRLLHPDDRERVLAAVARSNERGEPLSCEYRMIARDGRVVWFLDESVVVRDADGNPLYAQGYLLDITERKYADEERAKLLAREHDARLESERLAADYRRAHRAALHAAQRGDELVALLETIIETTPEPLAALGTDRHVRFANHHFRRATRLPAAYQDRPLIDLCPDFAAQIEPLIATVVNTGEPLHTDILIDTSRPPNRATTIAISPVFAADESVLGVTLRLSAHTP